MSACSSKSNTIDQFVDCLAGRVARLQRAMSHVDHPFRRVLRTLWPEPGSVTRTGAEQDALLLVFALLVARVHVGPAGASSSKPLRIDASYPGQSPLNCLLEQLNRARSTAGEAADLVDRIATELATADMSPILDELSTRYDTGWPLAYLFELLVARCDATGRRRRGIYFTPEPLVGYIVRSVDVLLRDQLHIQHGLASTTAPLRIVDPACGSGAFLLGVRKHLAGSTDSHGHLGSGSAGVRDINTARLAGIDVMPACRGAVSLLLDHDQQPLAPMASPATSCALYCANPLEDTTLCRTLFTDRIPVILGNPPYSNFGRLNRGRWILDQLTEYTAGLNERKINVHDDFIKFFRWAQYWIDRAGCGILGMVTSNTYLSALTLRRMRASLTHSFNRIYILDLHGGRTRQAVAFGAESSDDENVFAIQQGIAICLLVKRATGEGPRQAEVRHARIRGTRTEKLHMLSHHDVRDTRWTRVPLHGPSFFFVPNRRQHDASYDSWPRLDEIFRHYSSGVQTKRDALLVGFTPDEVHDRVRVFLSDAAGGRFAPDVPEWLRRKATGIAFDARVIRPYMVAPFDIRWVYYDPLLLGRARYQLMRHFTRENIGLVFMRQTTNTGLYDHFMASSILVSDRVFFSAHGAPFLAPLFLDSADDDSQRRINLRSSFVRQLVTRLGTPLGQRRGQLPDSFDAFDVFHWIYAVGHSATYRQRYDPMLRLDFPRIPWPRDLEQFAAWSRLGRRLLDVHDQVLRGASVVPKSPSGGAPPVAIARGYPRWQPTGQLKLRPDWALPQPVSQDVWHFRLGGYPVIQRWLKQRRTRGLEARELAHLDRLIRAVDLTIRLMDEIDQLPWSFA